ncbi:MAG: DUF5691 domain-containing protein, partial [Aggregatilineales bacterium]
SVPIPALSDDFAHRSLPEQVLLLSGIKQAQQQAGNPVFHTDVILPSCTPPDTRHICTDSVIDYLKLIFTAQTYAPVFPEFFQLMQATGQQLQPEHLPHILKIRRDNSVNTRYLIDLAAERYRWLIRVEPDFTVTRQLQALKSFRDTRPFAIMRDETPAAAREHLATTWQTLKPYTVYAHFRMMLNNLSLADEPFLNSVLLQTQDNSLRSIIIDLLTDLPDTQFIQQLTGFMLDVLHYDAETHSVTLQDEIIPQLQQYPLLKDFYDTSVDGENIRKQIISRMVAQLKDKSVDDESIRKQIISRVVAQLAEYLHPNYFCQAWSLTLPDLLSAAQADNAATFMLSAWVEAIHRTPDADAAMIVLQEIGDDLEFNDNVNLLIAILVQKSPGAAAIHKMLQQKKEPVHFMTAWVRACFESGDASACYDYLHYSIQHNLDYHPTMAKHLSVQQCRNLVLLLFEDTKITLDIKGLLNELLSGCGDGWDNNFSQAFIARLKQYFHRNRLSIVDVSFSITLMQAAYQLPLMLETAFINAITPIDHQPADSHTDEDTEAVQLKINDRVQDYLDIFRFRARMHAAIMGTS